MVDSEPGSVGHALRADGGPGTGRKLEPTTYIRSKARKEAHMTTSRVRQKAPDWPVDPNLATVLGLPPKDPNDDDEDDADDDDDDEGEEEPAVVREPDE